MNGSKTMATDLATIAAGTTTVEELFRQVSGECFVHPSQYERTVSTTCTDLREQVDATCAQLHDRIDAKLDATTGAEAEGFQQLADTALMLITLGLHRLRYDDQMVTKICLQIMPRVRQLIRGSALTTQTTAS